MRKLIILLHREKVSTFFATKTMRSFIILTWSKYRPAIIYNIFIPNLIYLFFFILLAYLELDQSGVNKEVEDEKLMSKCLLLITFCFSMFSYWIEFQKFKQEKISYFSDKWNVIDLISNSLNFFVMIILLLNLIFKEQYFPFEILMIFSSISCFGMWLKSLYWLRLFQNTAYFITLIG